jgi:hypothetical protein
MKLFGVALLVTGALATPTRDEKFLSVFNIVKFNNDVCTAASSASTMGTCYTASECTTLGGTADGTCASSFGVCCTAILDTTANSAGSAVRFNNTYISSPAATATPRQTITAITVATTYTYTIDMTSINAAQIRMDFEDVSLAAPASGMCGNGTGIFITGADTITQNVLPQNLCGELTGSHIYLSVEDASKVTITIKVGSAGTEKWRILVRFFESSQTDYLAPRGCLQYYKETDATIMSLNNNGGAGQLLTDHMYAICIASVKGYCNVAMTANNFALSGTAGTCTATDDKIVLGVDTYCGSTFGTAGSATWTYLGGDYIIPVMTGTTNTAANTGFEISYLLLPC